MTEIVLTDEDFAALERLVIEGSIFCKSIPFDDYFHFVRLKDLGFAVQETPNPNFLYELPEELRSEYQFKLTAAGYSEYLRLKQMRDERAKQEEDQRAKDAQAVLDQKKSRRHDFCVAAFGGAVTLFAEHFGEIIDLIELLLES